MKICKALLIVALFSLVGCVSTIKSIDDVPEAQRPVYDVTTAYMQCSAQNMTELMKTERLPAGTSPEDGLEQLAVKACDLCPNELDAFEAFVLTESKDQAFSEKEAMKLKERTQGYMVESILELAGNE